jgi:hypothetical protein
MCCILMMGHNQGEPSNGYIRRRQKVSAEPCLILTQSMIDLEEKKKNMNYCFSRTNDHIPHLSGFE